MVNVSANGFAFAAASDDFAELKGTQLILDIPDFPVKEERTMEGVVIRSTDNHGEYIVGCRMPEDSPAIQKYVNDNYKDKKMSGRVFRQTFCSKSKEDI